MGQDHRRTVGSQHTPCSQHCSGSTKSYTSPPADAESHVSSSRALVPVCEVCEVLPSGSSPSPLATTPPRFTTSQALLDGARRLPHLRSSSLIQSNRPRAALTVAFSLLRSSKLDPFHRNQRISRQAAGAIVSGGIHHRSTPLHIAHPQ